jgi:oxaloacetate decarboxylase gamma subunit
MTIFDMLEQSGILSVLGMGIVFGFLVIMVITITLVGKLIQALGLNKDVQQAPKPAPAAASTDNGAVTAAISAAVNEYRKTENR